MEHDSPGSHLVTIFRHAIFGLFDRGIRKIGAAHPAGILGRSYWAKTTRAAVQREPRGYTPAQHRHFAQRMMHRKPLFSSLWFLLSIEPPQKIQRAALNRQYPNDDFVTEQLRNDFRAGKSDARAMAYRSPQ
jgi:hypothetical protein